MLQVGHQRDSLKTTRLWRSRVLRFNPSPEIRTMVRLHKWQTGIGPRIGNQLGDKTWVSSVGSELEGGGGGSDKHPHLSTPTRSVHCSAPRQVESEANKDVPLSTTFCLPLFFMSPVSLITSHTHLQPPCRQIKTNSLPPTRSPHRHLASPYYLSL